MAFKLMVLACVMAVTHGSYIHGPAVHQQHGPSTVQYETEEVHYGSNTGSASQGESSSDQPENSIIRRPVISRGQLVSSHQKTVQITPSGSYAFSGGQEKPDIRVTNPGTYATNNYHISPSAGPAINHQQVIEYASTPSYSNGRNVNGYEHGVSSAYQHPISGYQTQSHNGVDVYRNRPSVRPVYQYVSSPYVLPHGVAVSYAHSNAYSAHVQPSVSTGTSGAYGAPYSSAAAVSHMSYSSPIGVSYNW